MEHWPGHERQERTKTTDKTTDKSKDKGKLKEHHLDSTYWQWPHLEHGSIGRGTLVSKNGRVQWSSVSDTTRDAGLRWLPFGRPTKVFPETRSPQFNIHEHSAYQRAEKGLQYLRTYFPDADFPGELLGNMLEADTREIRRLRAFDPFLGNLLEILPSHHTRNEYTVVFPMGELGRELNISRFSSDELGNMVFYPTGSPSCAFETPILQISSAVLSSEWIATPSRTLLIRTHTSSSLLRLEHSKVTRELDITRSETGDVPIVDSRILASGPDIVVVNQNGKIYKCNTYHGGKAMQSIRSHEVSDDDYFWQLGITGRPDECFLASHKAVKHIDLRSASATSDVFSLEHSSAIVTSFESPKHDYICRIASTSDVIWLDDRFRKRPLLSFKHYRSFDRTLRILTGDFTGASFSLLISRANGLVTLYDVGRGSDGLLHCNSAPSCLPHDEPVFRTYDGHALIALPSEVELSFLRLCQRGSIHRQDIRVVQPDEAQAGTVREGRVTHQWGEDIQILENRANELQIDFGPAGGRHYTEVNLRGAYEKISAFADDAPGDMDQNAFKDTLARLLDFWQDTEEAAESMLTTLDVISGIEDGNKPNSHPDFLAISTINSKQAFNALMGGHLVVQKLASRAHWHYRIHSTSIPGFDHHSVDCHALHEYLAELSLVSGVEEHDPSVRREADAREELVVDLALSNDVYSASPFAKSGSFATDETIPNTITHPVETIYSKEPPEVKLGYFRPVRKSGADHYADKSGDNEQEQGVSSPLGVRLLLAEWELGTDPNDYTYRDPYGLADIETQPIPQYRKLPIAAPTTQKKQIPPQRPPLVVAAGGTQPPAVHTMERAPAAVQSQTVERTHSQQFGPSFDVSSQEPMMSTQVIPGRFGGRPNAGKKLAKKRIGGF